MESSNEPLQEAKDLITRATKILDRCGQDIAAVHLQEAMEVLEYGHVLKPIVEVVRNRGSKA